MGNILQSIAGMGDMTEQVIATDLLLSTKAAVRNYAIAISETATPEVRAVLRRHLDTAIDTYESVLNYMIQKGFCHTDSLQAQMMVDMKAADTVLHIKQ